MKRVFIAQARTHEFDICLVSQSGVGHIKNENDNAFNKVLLRCNDLLCEFLARFVNAQGLSLVIAPRTREQWADEQIEHNYFKKYFGKDVNIAQRTDLMSTYKIMRRSRVVISLLSTCGWEALLWKQKTMHCPFYLSVVFGEYAPGKCTSNQDMWHWWLEEPIYEKFESMLLELLTMTEDQYWKIAERQANYGMNFGDRLTTHIIGDAIAAAVAGRAV
jgi:surface carbohydrate biosynthesis protein